MRTKDDVKYAFSSQKVDPTRWSKILRTEIAFKELASEMIELASDSADRTAAMRKLLEAKQGFVHAISHEVPAQEAGKDGKNQVKKS